MKKGFGILLVILSIFCLSACKNVKFVFSEEHACTAEFLVRKGETVYANYDESQMRYPTNASIGVAVDGQSEGPSFEGEKLDKVILALIGGAHSYVAITCETPFQEEVIITKVIKKWTDGSDKYSRIYSTDIHVKYSDATLEEPIFANTNNVVNGFGMNHGNLLAIDWEKGSTFDYSQNFSNIGNYVILFFGPKDSRLGIPYKDSYISINSIEAVTNEKVRIKSMKHTMYIMSDVSPSECTDLQETSFPIVIDDKEYENQNEFLFMYIYFEDTIENKSVYTGLTLKINLTIDGDTYDIYRDISYNRVPKEYYEHPDYYDENMNLA